MLMLRHINCYIESDCCLNYIKILFYWTICALEFCKLWKQSLGFVVMLIGTCMSATKEEIFRLNL